MSDVVDAGKLAYLQVLVAYSNMQGSIGELMLAPPGQDWKLVQITAPHFVAGVVAYQNTIKRAAPIISWAVGKKLSWLMSYCAHKGWRTAVCGSKPRLLKFKTTE